MEQIIGYVGILVAIAGALAVSGVMVWSKRDAKYETGANDGDVAQRMILEDLDRATETVYAVTCSGRDNYWGGKVTEKIAELADKKKVKFVFIVTRPYFFSGKWENRGLQSLAKDSKIELRALKTRPPLDARLIDYRDTYTSLHGSHLNSATGDDRAVAEPPRRYIHTWGYQFEEEIEETARYIADLLHQSEPVALSA